MLSDVECPDEHPGHITPSLHIVVCQDQPSQSSLYEYPLAIAAYRKKGPLVKINDIISTRADVYIGMTDTITEDDIKYFHEQGIETIIPHYMSISEYITQGPISVHEELKSYSSQESANGLMHTFKSQVITERSTRICTNIKMFIVSFVVIGVIGIIIYETVTNTNT